MKKIFSYFMISMCLLGTSVVTSCGSDDDDTPATLSTLPYEADAAVYELDSNSDKIAYVELTTAGNYFLEYKTMVRSNALYKVNDMEIYLPFAKRSTTTRGTKDNFEYGTFTKNSDGTYQLKDKNTTLKIETDGSRYKITIGDKAYSASKLNKKSSFADINKLCRSWRVKKIYYKFDTKIMGASTHIEEEASNYKDLANKLSKYETSTEFGDIEDIDYITFSNTGTCIVKTDSSIDRSYWQWSNGKILLDNDTSNGLKLTFEGATMKLDYEISLSYGDAGSASVAIGYELYETLLK